MAVATSLPPTRSLLSGRAASEVAGGALHSGVLRRKKLVGTADAFAVLKTTTVLAWYKTEAHRSADGVASVDGYLAMVDVLGEGQGSGSAKRGLGLSSALAPVSAPRATGNVPLLLQHGREPDQHPKYRLLAPSREAARAWEEAFARASTAPRRRRSIAADVRKRRHSRSTLEAPLPTPPPPPPAAAVPADAPMRVRAPARPSRPRGKAAAVLGEGVGGSSLDLAALSAAATAADEDLEELAERLENALDERDDLLAQKNLLSAAVKSLLSTVRSSTRALSSLHESAGWGVLPSPPPAGEGQVAVACAGLHHVVQSLQASSQSTPVAPVADLSTMAADVPATVCLEALACAADRCSLMRRFPLAASMAGAPLAGLLPPHTNTDRVPRTTAALGQVGGHVARSTQCRVPLAPLQDVPGLPPSLLHPTSGTAHPIPAVPRRVITLSSPATTKAAAAALAEARMAAAVAAGDVTDSDSDSASEGGESLRQAMGVAKQLGQAAADAFLERVAAATAAIDELPRHNGLTALRSFFALYAPEKLGTEAQVLSDFAGREEALFSMLERKYHRPVRVPYLPLSSLPSAPGMVLQPHWRPHHWEQWRAHVAVQEVLDAMVAATASAGVAPSPAAGPAPPEVGLSTGAGGGGTALADTLLASLGSDGAAAKQSTVCAVLTEDDAANAALLTALPDRPHPTVCQGEDQWVLQAALLLKPPTPAPWHSSPPQWVEEEQVLHCQMCTSAFTMVNRPHHCRSCARVLCGACAPAPGTALGPSARAHLLASVPATTRRRQDVPASPRAGRGLVWHASLEGQGAVSVVPGDDRAADFGAHAKAAIAGQALPEYGYAHPVRVCLDCMHA